jgi:hypothetical protein
MLRTLRLFGFLFAAIILAIPAKAAAVLTQIDMTDTDGGGWTTAANDFEFHLFVTPGTNPAGGFVNSGTDVPLPATDLGIGDNVFTLVGNDNSGLESQGIPVITLYFSDGSMLFDSAGNTNSITLTDGTTVALTQFIYIPYQDSGVNLVNDHSDSPDGYADTVADITLDVTPAPEPASIVMMLSAGSLLGLFQAVRRRRVRA